ncbi:hypothetical protein [Planctomycetes bacterium TBK1r]|uniref:Cellulose synthase subunit BcsC n=1 Tax=Stieleria magnilauensis TaxID=2527963 RepID=A0ABX5XRA3_9BACT|nr:cellulose synthase subunit BcsC [Planctomycetes bacterium TBK1r]
MAHQVIIAPDFETSQMQQLPTDWRPGVRVSVVTIKAFPLGAASVVIAVLLVGLIACSGVVGTINGAGMTGLIFGGVIAAVLAVCYAALVLAIELLLPEVETVVDWTQNTIVHRRNRSQETFPLDQLTELRITPLPEPNQNSVELQLVVGDRSIPLLTTDRCESTEQACRLVAVAGRHLATVTHTRLVAPPEIPLNDMTRDARAWSDGYVSTGATAVAMMRMAENAGNSDEAERHRREAMDYFDIANRIDPDNPAPLLKLGELSGDADAGKRAVEQALAADPDSPDALIQLAKIQDRDGDTDLAKQNYDRAVSIDRCVETLQARALFFQIHDRFDEAVNDFDDAMERVSDDDERASLLDMRSDCYRDWFHSSDDRRHLERAIKDARKTVSLHPDHSRNLASLLIDAEEYTEAIAILDDQIMNEEEDSYVFGLLGRAFLQQGIDMDSAIFHLTRAIEIEEAAPPTSTPQWRDIQRRSLSYLYTLRSEAHNSNEDVEASRRDMEMARELNPP